MRFEGLDLNLLVALDAILEERSVVGASRRLHLSQPAMSGAIGRLRAYFNDEIFTISQRKLVPTPLALSLERPTRDVLLRIRANLIATPEFDPATSTRHFRLIVSDYASIVLMNAVMRRVYRAAPQVSIEFLPFDDRVDERLQRGEVDFVVIPDARAVDGHPKQHLFTDEFCCVAWNRNRKIGSSLSLKGYLELGHVTAQFGPARRGSYEEHAIQQLGYRRRIEVVAQNFTMMATMVVGTDRVATMHSRLAAIFAHNLPLKLLPVPIRIPEFRESIQWPAPFDKNPAQVWMRGIISDVAAGLDRSRTPKRHIPNRAAHD